MNNHPRSVRIGTRASALARWQTEHVGNLLKRSWDELEIHFQIITTRGDQVLDTSLPMIGGKRVFTAELEAALHHRKDIIDYAIARLLEITH